MRAVGLQTGVEELDRLLGGGIEESSLTEFYSPDLRVLSLLYHRMAVLAAQVGRVLALHMQDFGGLDPYLLRSMARRLQIPWDVVESHLKLARAFKLEDAVNLLAKAQGESADFALVFDPYMHWDWRRGWLATTMTWLLKSLTQDRTVVTFNRALEGRWSPLGGSYHAHSVHALIRLEASRRSLVRAILVKHPSLPPGAAWFSLAELEGLSWGGRRLLSEWL